MIIENGSIEIKKKSAAGIDPETGHPIKPSDVSWGDPIPCQYSANRYSNIGQVRGEHFKTAEYSVLIEAQPFDAEQIRLKNRCGNIVGEFSVISAEPLDAVCQIRILI